MKTDILAFGAHPDDIELSCAGTLLVEQQLGKTTVVIDLTQGELGTRGNEHTRLEEATNASKILKISSRENLKMRDGFFVNDEAHQKIIINSIRKYQPELILCNAPDDRHPDHGRAAKLISDAAFLSGLLKIKTYNVLGADQMPWRPKYVLHYVQDRYLKPDVIIDISAVIAEKIEAIKAYKTQFYDAQSTDHNQTYISTPEFLDGIIARAAMFGKMIGVKYGEGYLSKKTIGISSFEALIKNNT